MMVIPHHSGDRQLITGWLEPPPSLCGHQDLSPLSLQCAGVQTPAFRESRQSLNIITLVIIFTILFFNFFVKLGDELRQNVTKQSRKEIDKPSMFWENQMFEIF